MDWDPYNLTPQEQWRAQRDRFLAIVQRIIEEPPPTEPYTPPEGNIPIACQCSLCKRKDIPTTKFPPYIPLAHR